MHGVWRCPPASVGAESACATPLRTCTRGRRDLARVRPVELGGYRARRVAGASPLSARGDDVGMDRETWPACSRVRRGSWIGWRRRAVRHTGRPVHGGPDHRPRHARGRAARAHRCPSAPRRAARHGVRAELRRAGLRPAAGHGRLTTAPRSTWPPSSSASTTPTRRASASATACSWPAGRGPPCCPGSPRPSTADREAERRRALDAVVDIAIDRHAKLAAPAAEATR